MTGTHDLPMDALVAVITGLALNSDNRYLETEVQENEMVSQHRFIMKTSVLTHSLIDSAAPRPA